MTGKLQFKFINGAPEKERAVLDESLRERGATEVRPLFPGEPDPELAAICIVEYNDPGTGGKLLEYLQRSKVVEFAEDEISRKLIK